MSKARPSNGPSTTGNSSGKGRGNNPSNNGGSTSKPPSSGGSKSK